MLKATQRKEKYYVNKAVRVLQIPSDENQHTFFGYYNLIPDNGAGLVLFCGIENPKYCSRMDILIYDAKNGKTTKIGETHAWNWQQGCMAQWYGKERGDIIFNTCDFEGKKYISEISNISTGRKRFLDFPIYTVSHDYRYALSLNFKRLQKFRPEYGYYNFPCEKMEDDTDGIWRINTNLNQCDLIFNFYDLLNFHPPFVRRNKGSWVNHLEFNRDNNRYIFFHRFLTTNGRIYSRLFSSDLVTGNLIKIWESDMISHFCWKSDNEVISWARIKGIGERLFCFNIDSPGKYFPVGERYFRQDGHPSLSTDKRWLIIDTYPNYSRHSYLYLYDMLNDAIIELGSFFQPLKYTDGKRCDLHPKWSADSSKVFLESCHTGIRKLYLLELGNILCGK